MRLHSNGWNIYVKYGIQQVPVTTNAVAQKIAKEVQEIMGQQGGQPNGKREVIPSER